MERFLLPGLAKKKTDARCQATIGDWKPSYDPGGIGTIEGEDENGLFFGLGFNYHISEAAAITFGYDLYDSDESLSYTHIGLRYYLR